MITFTRQAQEVEVKVTEVTLYLETNQLRVRYYVGQHGESKVIPVEQADPAVSDFFTKAVKRALDIDEKHELKIDLTTQKLTK